MVVTFDPRHLALLRELASRRSIIAVAAATYRTPSAVSQQLCTARYCHVGFHRLAALTVVRSRDLIGESWIKCAGRLSPQHHPAKYRASYRSASGGSPTSTRLQSGRESCCRGYWHCSFAPIHDASTRRTRATSASRYRGTALGGSDVEAGSRRTGSGAASDRSAAIGRSSDRGWIMPNQRV